MFMIKTTTPTIRNDTPKIMATGKLMVGLSIITNLQVAGVGFEPTNR